MVTSNENVDNALPSSSEKVSLHGLKSLENDLVFLAKSDASVFVIWDEELEIKIPGDFSKSNEALLSFNESGSYDDIKPLILISLL